MSDNALTPFDSGPVPAHISNAFAGLGSNLPEKQTVPSLSPGGKTWTITLDGNATKLMTKTADGDQVPLSVFKAIILDAAPRRGRQFYPGSYDPNKVAPPTCWSADGIAPDKSLPDVNPDPADPAKPHKIAATCQMCPNSVKGSKVLDNGNATTACGQHRMLAVIPAGKPDFPALRLKIAITSDWDSQSPEEEAQGWYSFSKYCDFLKSRGCPHSAAIVTKMKFDQNATYPKLFFSADRWLTEAEQAVVAKRVQTPEVQKLLGGDFTPAGADGVATAPAAEPEPAKAAPQPEPEVVAKKAEAKPAPAAVVEEEVMIFGAEEDVPAAAAAKPATKPKAVAAEASPQVSNNVPSGIADLLADWT